MKTSRFVPLALLFPLLGGCDATSRVATDSLAKKFVSAVLTRKRSSQSSAAVPDTAYLATLKPFNSGEGLIVFEPVVDKASASWGNLGGGVGRYLQVHVAGQGELGKTPLWGYVDDLRKRCNFPNMRLNGAQARQVALPSGATKVAVGTLSGNAAKLTLRYQLLDVRNGKVLGNFQCSVPAAQVPSQLPLLARQMALRLGVTQPKIPSRLTLTSDELAFLGAQRRRITYGVSVPLAVRDRLAKLAPQDAVAGVVTQRICTFNKTSDWQKIADDLLKNAPDNTLVAGEVGWLGPKRLMFHMGELDALAQKYPRNYLLSTGKMEFHGATGSRSMQLRWAENAVRANPKCALPWVELADVQGDVAEDLRQSRWASKISATEWAQLNAIYPKAHAASLRATEVDPKCSVAWSRLSVDAEFNGDDTLATTSLWHALQLDPSNQQAYEWGSQQCQPKWGGDAATVLKFATFAASHADQAYIDTGAILDGLKATGQRAAFRGILQTVAAKDPNNSGALAELAYAYHYEDRNYGPAEPLYVAALEADPTNAKANSGLGDLLFFVHHDSKGAEAHYRRAIAKDFTDGYYHANLGRCLALSGRKAEGIAEANQAKALGYHDAGHQIWGATGVDPN